MFETSEVSNLRVAICDATGKNVPVGVFGPYPGDELKKVDILARWNTTKVVLSSTLPMPLKISNTSSRKVPFKALSNFMEMHIVFGCRKGTRQTLRY